MRPIRIELTADQARALLRLGMDHVNEAKALGLSEIFLKITQSLLQEESQGVRRRED